MTGIARRSGLLVLLASAFILGGCAFGTRNPTLTYPPTSESGATSIAYAAERPTLRSAQIVLNRFVDQRSDTKTVGTVRNAWGMRTADVIPTNSVSDWVTQAVKTELERNGYTVTEGNSGDSPASTSVVVSGDILNAFCDMYFSYTGQVSLVTRVQQGGKEVLNRHYAGEGSAGVAFAATGESYAQSLALALSSALRQFVADLGKSLSAQ
ncbi:YajG family lipoprotein [Ralstonia thomasii]|jgi:uncharacterized lipoprotein YajG|uniref:Lipoprotein n=1 Tax=Ralstonia thomasii TaxID=3058596 RepID=A0ABN9ICR0_9RALS|nr:YajG family lipoprotein [Ralstonia sp. LMG 18095]CAJ0775141.1 hypothetical protein LMG18095_00010 [Ralstonia sp. LMG 18095]